MNSETSAKEIARIVYYILKNKTDYRVATRGKPVRLTNAFEHCPSGVESHALCRRTIWNSSAADAALVGSCIAENTTSPKRGLVATQMCADNSDSEQSSRKKAVVESKNCF